MGRLSLNGNKSLKGRHLLAGDFSSVSHHGPLLLIGGNLNVVAVASIVAVPKQQPEQRENKDAVKCPNWLFP